MAGSGKVPGQVPNHGFREGSDFFHFLCRSVGPENDHKFTHKSLCRAWDPTAPLEELKKLLEEDWEVPLPVVFFSFPRFSFVLPSSPRREGEMD